MTAAAPAATPDAGTYRASMRILCVMSFLIAVDRLSFSMLIQPIGKEFQLSDTQSGLLTGIAFSAMYAIAAIPMARWADVGDRRVIVAISMAVWSVMTALGGLAQLVWQLFMSRFGVGFGEAGSSAPVQSLIADYYPPERRSLPLSMLGLATAAGGILGFALVGIAADRLGWRNALVLLSVPGVLVALLVMRRVIEPRALAPLVTGAPAARPPFSAALAGMLKKKSFVHISVGLGIWGIASQGIGQWLPTFFLRAHNMTLTQTGVLLGLVSSALCIGLVFGGVIGNRMMARDLRWGLWLPVFGMVSYAALSIGALVAPALGVALAFFALAAGIAGLIIGPLLATVSGLVRADVRTVSLAVMGLLTQVVGGGLGPLAVGALSDALKDSFGLESLRFGLALASLPMFWGALHFQFAARHLLAEFEELPR